MELLLVTKTVTFISFLETASSNNCLVKRSIRNIEWKLTANKQTHKHDHVKESVDGIPTYFHSSLLSNLLFLYLYLLSSCSLTPFYPPFFLFSFLSYSKLSSPSICFAPAHSSPIPFASASLSLIHCLWSCFQRGKFFNFTIKRKYIHICTYADIYVKHLLVAGSHNDS